MIVELVFEDGTSMEFDAIKVKVGIGVERIVSSEFDTLTISVKKEEDDT